MALASPIISLISAIGTTATFSFTADPLATETVFYLLDPVTGLPLLTFPSQVIPTATLVGLDPTLAYDVIAVSFTNPGPTDLSPPSLSVPIRPESWQGALKNVIIAEPIFGARYYEIRNLLTNAVLQTNSKYPCFVDNQVFLTELEATNFNYAVFAYTSDSDVPQCLQIVERYRTNKALCLIYGQMNQISSYPGWPKPIRFYPKGYRVQPIVQRSFQINRDVMAYANYIGEWGVFLMSNSIIACNFDDKLFEFVVPFAASAELVTLPLVNRSLAPKNT